MNQLFHPSTLLVEAPMSAERDLLSSIFQSDQPYPWEPLSPEGEAYLSRLEAELDDPEVDEAIAQGWSDFAAQMEAQWGTISRATAETLFNRLKGQFQGRIPDDALGTVANSAVALVHTGRPLVEQLVETVKTILPGWETDDLVVLARPLAFSLRDGRDEILEFTLRSAPQTPWGSLSDLEKARLGLAIASVALDAAQQEG